ncbi:outer membrane beta-barrel protein [Rheinheimera baltica]|uniref:outer membrane beta-barrel protein n=1 Tax=Rheinheimera baltica TaxID=67576 RepID=UPI0004267654|nr:outer membrane beta-barrel protein [Rheinheimera baltica]
MRNLLKTTLLTSVLAAAAVSGAAQAEVYFEAGLMQVSTDIESENISHFGALGVVGTTLNATDKFAHKVEAIAGLGLNSDKVYGVDVKMESFFGAAYRPTIKLNDSVELYGRVGYFHGRVKASANGYSDSDSSSEVGYGIGIDFKKVSLSYLYVDDTNFLMATYRF